MLGVALAFSVSLINASALSEFSQAVRSVNGQPDLELRAAQGSLDEALYARVATDPRVAVASPVLELGSYALDTSGKRVALRVVGVDALLAERARGVLDAISGECQDVTSVPLRDEIQEKDPEWI